MRIPKGRGRSVLLILSGVLVGSLLVGTAVATSSILTASAFRYSKPRTGHVSVGPGAFGPSSFTNTNTNYSLGPSYLTSDVNRCFNTGLQFPNRATLTTASFVYASGSGSEFSAYVFRNTVGQRQFETLASVAPMDDSSSNQTVTVSIPQEVQRVSTARYAYWILVCVGPTTFLDNATVTYTYLNAGD